MEPIHMTYYEWIEACLKEDAKAHPFPGQGLRLSALLQKAEQEEQTGDPQDGDGG